MQSSHDRSLMEPILGFGNLLSALGEIYYAPNFAGYFSEQPQFAITMLNLYRKPLPNSYMNGVSSVPLRIFRWCLFSCFLSSSKIFMYFCCTLFHSLICGCIFLDICILYYVTTYLAKVYCYDSLSDRNSYPEMGYNFKDFVIVVFYLGHYSIWENWICLEVSQLIGRDHFRMIWIERPFIISIKSIL